MSRGRYIVVTILGLLLFANIVIFFTYRVRQQARVNELKASRDQFEAQLLDASNVRESKERQLKELEDTIASVNDVYSQRWATPRERLVPLILEIRSLAQKSRLKPEATNYASRQESKESNVSVIEISFGVKGEYQQVRRLISLVEQSQQFVYIDSISLTGSEGSSLQINLRLKTLFSEPAKRPASGSTL